MENIIRILVNEHDAILVLAAIMVFVCAGVAIFFFIRVAKYNKIAEADPDPAWAEKWENKSANFFLGAVAFIILSGGFAAIIAWFPSRLEIESNYIWDHSWFYKGVKKEGELWWNFQDAIEKDLKEHGGKYSR